MTHFHAAVVREGRNPSLPLLTLCLAYVLLPPAAPGAVHSWMSDGLLSSFVIIIVVGFEHGRGSHLMPFLLPAFAEFGRCKHSRGYNKWGCWHLLLLVAENTRDFECHAAVGGPGPFF